VLVPVTLAAMLAIAGTGYALDPPLDGFTRAASDGPGPATDPTPTVVTVRFRNLAVDEAVHVEFDATNDALATLPDDLFVEGNLVTEYIGVAGMGILEPLREVALEFPCTAQLAVETSGGTFLDNDSGEIRGAGVARWAQDAALGLCGHKVLFELANESGTFTTRVAIGN